MTNDERELIDDIIARLHDAKMRGRSDAFRIMAEQIQELSELIGDEQNEATA